jgi:glycosyltransferase involved in cell wall biosynthesis
MHILFLTHYFPPEVNAPASRTYENARKWVAEGHPVTVLTCVPNHPSGIPYPGYENRLYRWEELDGIRVLRVKTYLSANKGFLKRTLNYLSYMTSAILFSSLVRRVDVVISTSPQFFCGLSGYFVSSLKRCRWVLEIRDLWPESIIAVGAITNRHVIAFLEALETFMYRKADRIVTVTDYLKLHITRKNIDPNRISVIKNGADLERFRPLPRQNGFRDRHGLNGKFVASYIGTHGMAHGLGTIFRAAELLRDHRRIVFLLVGDGAERERLLREKEARNLDNILMLPQQEKSKMPEIIAASDVNLVLLRKGGLFKGAIPSKIFEAMAMERPVVLGVDGECKEIVETGECGVCIEPESAEELANTLRRLSGNVEMADRLGKNGRTVVERYYNRDVLAGNYLSLIRNLVRA